MFSLAEGCGHGVPRTLSAITERALSHLATFCQPPLSHVPIASLAIHQARAVLAVWQRTAPNTRCDAERTVLTSSLLDCLFLSLGADWDITSCRRGEPWWWEPVAVGGRCKVPDHERGIGPTNRDDQRHGYDEQPWANHGWRKVPIPRLSTFFYVDIGSKPDLSDLLDVQPLEHATDPLKKLYRRDGENACF